MLINMVPNASVSMSRVMGSYFLKANLELGIMFG